MENSREIDRQMAILTADTSEVIPQTELRTKLEKSLKTGIPLRIKMGIDPTAPDVHLGHMVVYKKMRQFQDLGHRAVLIIGDYTARIGDPTGRNSERPPLTESEVKKNCETYTSQIFKIVDSENTEVHYQSSWFDKVSLHDVLTSASAFSVAHMLTHDTFKKRLDSGARLSLHEMMYPVLQSWDSIFVKADVELGGSDQKFNILCGRDLQRQKGLEPQVVLLMPLLSGTDGRKMSKSFNNHIPVLSTPQEKFGRIMSISDELIVNFFTYATSLSPDEVDAKKKRLKKENPRNLKLELAGEIISLYDSREAAVLAEKEFLHVFSRKLVPEKIREYRINGHDVKLTAILKDSGITGSISEGKRLITQGGIKVDGEKITDPDFCPIDKGSGQIVIKAGKRQFLKVLFS